MYIYIHRPTDPLILSYSNDNHHNKHLRPEAWTWDEHVGRVAEERSWENHRIIQRMNCWYRKIRAILHLHAGTQYQYSIHFNTALHLYSILAGRVFFPLVYGILLVEPATFASRAWIANVLEPTCSNLTRQCRINLFLIGTSDILFQQVVIWWFLK